MPSIELTEGERESLLDLAMDSIEYGLTHDQPLTIELAEFSSPLTREAATFVTLKKMGALRGCIGTLEAFRPLVDDVVRHAFAAAFEDPRFPPLVEAELPDLDLSISILSDSQSIEFLSESDLLENLNPGIDGVILEDQGRRATFLPSVWSQLPGAKEFMDNLKVKAGLPVNHWSSTLSIRTYSVLEIGRGGKN